jgi:hypothetical protein
VFADFCGIENSERIARLQKRIQYHKEQGNVKILQDANYIISWLKGTFGQNFCEIEKLHIQILNTIKKNNWIEHHQYLKEREKEMRLQFRNRILQEY